MAQISQISVFHFSMQLLEQLIFPYDSDSRWLPFISSLKPVAMDRQKNFTFYMEIPGYILFNLHIWSIVYVLKG